MKRLMFSVRQQLRQPEGFTLVEQLIVIGIIAILATIATLAYTSVQKDARDREREGDVAVIMNALEEYYEKHGEYPADDEFNPTYSPTRLPNFDLVKSMLPRLTDSDLTGPNDYQFYAGCLNINCSNTSAHWETYHTKSYRYASRFTGVDPEGDFYYTQVPASYGNNTGWGCKIQTYFDDPGYAIAWRSEVTKLWIFKRSIHGVIDITNYDTGPVAPQTCTFS